MGLLVLARDERQSVVLRDRDGNHIATIIYLKKCSGGQIRLGFEAGPDVRILRAELDRPAIGPATDGPATDQEASDS